MPAKQTLCRQLRTTVGRGIQHHLDHAFHMPIHRRHGPHNHAQPPGQRRAHRAHVQTLPLNLAGLQHILGQHSQAGFRPLSRPQILQAPQQPPLSLADLDEQRKQHRQVMAPARPVRLLPDVARLIVHSFSAEYADIRTGFAAESKARQSFSWLWEPFQKILPVSWTTKRGHSPRLAPPQVRCAEATTSHMKQEIQHVQQVQ